MLATGTLVFNISAVSKETLSVMDSWQGTCCNFLQHALLFAFQSCEGAREATCCTNSAAASADIDTVAEGEVIWVYPSNLNRIQIFKIQLIALIHFRLDF